MQSFKLSTELASLGDLTPYKALIESFDQKYLVGLTKIGSVQAGFREQHHAGDELLIVLSGKATFICQHEGKTERVSVTGGEVLFVPKDSIHTAESIEEELHILFLTPNLDNASWVETASLPN